MLIKRTKDVIKSFPAAYKILSPVVNIIRRVRHGHFNASLQIFRKYCADLPDLAPESVFVKVGANDGISGDPCSDILLSNSKWKGILIEPVPYCVDRLRTNFNDASRFSVEAIAIGPAAEKKAFYYVDQAAIDVIPDLPLWFDQLGSFDKSRIMRALDGILIPFIVETHIEVSPLSDLLDRKGIGDFHLLHIDAEGFDFEVLKTLDFSSHVPVIILIEHVNLSKSDKREMRSLLRSQGYSIRNCGEDYFALHRKAYSMLREPGSAQV